MLMITLDELLAIVHELIKVDISCAPLKIPFGEPLLRSFPFYPVAKNTGLLEEIIVYISSIFRSPIFDSCLILLRNLSF